MKIGLKITYCTSYFIVISKLCGGIKLKWSYQSLLPLSIRRRSPASACGSQLLACYPGVAYLPDLAQPSGPAYIRSTLHSPVVFHGRPCMATSSTSSSSEQLSGPGVLPVRPRRDQRHFLHATILTWESSAKPAAPPPKPWIGRIPFATRKSALLGT
jgi:hypothetical protein